MRTEGKPELLLDTSLQMSLHLSEKEIREAVQRLAKEISRDYAGKRPLLLGVLKGAFIFLADLMREIDIPLTVDFIRAQSYKGSTTTGEAVLSMGDVVDVKGQHVLVVEDIVDSGTTVNWFFPLLEERDPRSLELCTLLCKQRASLDRQPRWVGFDAPGEFLVGYGLDSGEDLSHLPYIASV